MNNKPQEEKQIKPEIISDSYLYKQLLKFEKNICHEKKFTRKDLGF